MTRDSESGFIGFCARQQGAFEADDWLRNDSVDREEKTIACLFLSGTDWYGHRQALAQVAERLLPGAEAQFASLVQRVKFDFIRFSNLLRRELRHAPSAS